MNICKSCGVGILTPILNNSPFMVVKNSITDSELTENELFVQRTKNKWGYDEDTTSYYLNREFGYRGLSLRSFSLASFYQHKVPKKGNKEVLAECERLALEHFIEIAKDKKIIFLMGAEAIRIVTGYGASSVYGLVCKSEYLPNVPVIIPAPNSDKLMSQPIGELRNSIRVLSEQIEIYRQYQGAK